MSGKTGVQTLRLVGRIPAFAGMTGPAAYVFGAISTPLIAPTAVASIGT